MNRVQHVLMVDSLEAMLRKLRTRTPSCRTCNYFWEKDGQCGKFKAAPPKEFLKVGCDEWLDDEVPF